MIIRTLHDGLVVHTGIIEVETTVLITAAQGEAVVIVDAGAAEGLIQPIGALQVISACQHILDITGTLLIVLDKILVEFLIQILAQCRRRSLIQVCILILHQHEVAGTHRLHAVGQLLHARITGVVKMQHHLVLAIRIGIFGRNDDYTVCTLCTVDSRCSSILQYVHRSDVVRRDIRDRTNRHTVHDIQRVIALGQRGTTTHTDLHLCIRTTFRSRHRYTGQLTLQRLSRTGNRYILDLVSTYRRNCRHQVTFLGRTVTGNYHFLQHFAVLTEHYVQHVAGDGQLLRLHTDVGEHQHFRIIGHIEGVITVEIRHCTDRGTLNNH